MNKDCLDFYIIGAQKAGTTWLHRRLNEIDGYNLPKQKEMHFFCRSKKKYPQHPSKFNKPLPLAEALKKGGKSILSNLVRGQFFALQERHLYYFGKYDISWYKAYMNLHAKKGITGDITPSYATLKKEDIKLMAEVAPSAKVFYLLRDPIERLWSQWRMYLNKHNIRHKVNDLSFFKKWHKGLLPNSYLENIAAFSSFFHQNFYLLFYDAINDQPFELLQSVHQKITHDAPINTAHINVDKKEQQSFADEKSPEIYKYLLEVFEAELKDLHESIGGYCTQWYAKHKKGSLLNDEVPRALIPAHDILI